MTRMLGYRATGLDVQPLPATPNALFHEPLTSMCPPCCVEVPTLGAVGPRSCSNASSGGRMVVYKDTEVSDSRRQQTAHCAHLEIQRGERINPFSMVVNFEQIRLFP